MEIYFFILFVILSSSFIIKIFPKKVQKQLFVLIMFLFFSFIIGFRSHNTANDTFTYINLFKTISQQNNSIFEFSDRYEIGYLLLNRFLSFITMNPQIILIASGFLIMLGFSYFINKYSEIPWLSFYLFFTMRYFNISMVTIRLALAIVIILKSYKFLINDSLFKFLSTVIMASLFHMSALIFLLAWPVKKLRLDINSVLMIYIPSTFFVYLSFDFVLDGILFVFPKYNYYLDSVYLNSGIQLASVMNVLVALAIFLFGIIIMKYLKIYSFNNNMFQTNINEIIMSKLIFFSMIINIISFKFSLFGRLSKYFLVFSIVYIPNVIKKIKDKNLRMLLILLIIFLSFSYSFSTELFRPNWSGIYPYNFFW